MSRNTWAVAWWLFVLCGFGLSGAALGEAPWWDDYPRIVEEGDLQTVQNLHGSVGFTGGQRDPGWGTYGQKVTRMPTQLQPFQSAGLKVIGYFETFGTCYCFIGELGPYNGDFNSIITHYWSWEIYHGGPTYWIGVHNFFDDEVTARPYTRTHPVYGGPAMTYPDGTMATGYAGDPTDPRTSRVYDACIAKNIFGELSYSVGCNDAVNEIDPDTGEPTGPLDGLIYVPEQDCYAGMFSFRKDSACPLWEGFTYASTLMAASEGLDGMWTDNHSPWDSFGNPPVKIAFGDWSVARFRTHLSDNFSPAELTAMGVTDVATFDIREWLKTRATGWGWNGTNLGSSVWKDARWLDEPLWRAYSIFKRQAGAEAIGNYYNAVKTAAAAAGKSEFLVQGNDIPVFSMGWVRGDLDMVSTEVSVSWNLSSGPRGFMLPPEGRMAPFYKLAREHAQSRFTNVWMYNDGFEAEMAQPGVADTLYYEMMAAHTLPMFHPDNERVAGNEQTNSDFFAFVEQAAPTFGDRVDVEEIGVYYSSSSLLADFTPGGFVNFSDQAHQFAHWGWATALGNLHHQYRYVPEWKLTADTLADLRALIVPEAIVFDDGDIGVLTAWVQDGGRLVVTGSSGRRLGEDNNFEVAPGGYTLQSLTTVSDINAAPSTLTRGVGAGLVHYIKDNIGREYFNASTTRPTLLGQFDAVMTAMLSGTGPAMVTPGSGVTSLVGLTAYEDSAATRFFVDVNNYDLDVSTDVITDTAALTFTVQMPDWIDHCTAVAASVVSPDVPVPTVQATLISPGVVEVDLSPVHRYASVVLERPVNPDGDLDGVGDACDLCPGTWPGTIVDGDGCPLFAPVDFDQDGDVDVEDFGHMQLCLTTSIEVPAPGCENADVDGDDHIDAYDVAVFTACLSGPDQPADLYCGDGL